MTRLLSTILSGVLLAAAVLLPAPPTGDPPAVPDDPAAEPGYGIGSFSYCPWSLSDGDRRSFYIAVAQGPAAVRLSFLEGGRVEAPLSAQPVTGESGTVASFDNPRPLGVSSGFVEFDGSEGATAVVSSGEDILAGYLCPSGIPATWHLPGGSTLAGEELVLRLFNPFTVDARVDLWALSELGSEADDRLEGLTVPARNTRIVTLDEMLDRRESLAIIVRPTTGSVIPVMAFARETDRAVWAGTGPSRGWEFPVVSVGGLEATLVLTNEGSLEVNYLVEVFDGEGAYGTPMGGAIEGPGQVRIPLIDLPASGAGLRVTGDGLFGAAVVGRSGTAVAVTPGLPTNASTWLAPGPRSEGAAAAINFLNTGVADVTVTYTPLSSSGEEGFSESLTLPAASTVSVTLTDPGTDAVTVTGDGPFTVGWWAESGGRVAFGGALPGG